MAPRTRVRRPRVAGVLAVATATVLALASTSFATAGTRAAGVGTPNAAAHISKRAFHDGMRRLWVDHVTWTRLFIVSVSADLPDLRATTDRLLQNQVDIGDAVKPFYGRAAGSQLTELLTQHILTAADLLTAAKAGNTAAFEQAKDAWYANARQIAAFLHEANPRNWPLADLREMMKDHLDLTLQEASDQLTGDFAASVGVYDAVETEILHMADTLSSGIIEQFPNRFA